VSVDAVLLNSGGTAVVSTLLRLPRLRELRCRAVPESLVGLRLQVQTMFVLKSTHTVYSCCNDCQQGIGCREPCFASPHCSMRLAPCLWRRLTDVYSRPSAQA